MKSSSVAVMAGWGFMEWCMTRMAGSGEGQGGQGPDTPKPAPGGLGGIHGVGARG